MVSALEERQAGDAVTGDSGSRPRVLVFAYACEPGRGSEPGAGWGLVRAVREFADCVVLVGPVHAQHLKRWAAEHGDSSVTFVEVPEPWFGPYLRWHRIPWFLAYLGWLRKAYGKGVALHRQQAFDLVHHATYSVYWLPAPLTRFGVPTVWGPVGGAVSVRRELWKVLGLRGMLSEVVDRVAVRLAARWPATRRMWRDVTVAIAQNRETRRALPPAVREHTVLLNHVLFTDIPRVSGARRGTHVLYVSALESRKGPRLAVHALATTPDHVRMLVAGDGPERPVLERLAERLGVFDRIQFLGTVPRDRVLSLLAEAAAVVFTGLREEGGVTLAEAMLVGTPTIVLAHGGPRTIAESALDQSRVVLIEPAEFAETAHRFGQAMTQFAHGSTACNGANLDQADARRRLRQAFATALASGARGHRPPPQASTEV